MSINGISNGYAQRPLPSAQTGAGAIREQGIRQQQGARVAPEVQIATQPALRGAQAAPGASASLPAEAPSGTDPKLWSILTSEERGFFAKSQAMGPLTYGRVMAARTQPEVPAVRGGRLDIRG
ncbi:MAG: hypothetical protein ABJE47_22580 [bacterium]